jgi:hypothetical protein
MLARLEGIGSSSWASWLLASSAFHEDPHRLGLDSCELGSWAVYTFAGLGD